MSRVLSVLASTVIGLSSTAACASSDEAPPPPASVDSSTSPTAASSSTPSTAPTPEEPIAGDHDLTVTIDGTDRRVLLHAPPAVEGKGRLPLVLAFHGSPSSPEEVARTSRWNDLADDERFVVAYPEYFTETADVLALVDHLVEHWRVDPGRVHASGFSFGAATTYRLAIEASDRIASFAPVSGIHDVPDEPLDPAPLLAVQGLKDRLASSFGFLNRSWAGRADCGRPTEESLQWRVGPVRRTTAACAGGSEHVVYRAERMGHEWPREATGLIWAFFERHPLSG